LLREALIELDSYFFAPRGIGGRDPKMHRHHCGSVYFPAEVTRAGRDRGPGGRGMTYTAYTLTSLVQALEIARYAGFDWWDRQAENGLTPKEAVASYIRWMDLGVEFPWHDDPYRYESDGPRRNPHEIIHNHFPGYVDGLDRWLAQHRPVNGRQGDPYVTLNRGDVHPR
uniref:alginate lyase family protein n=1 Tax=Aquisalimonas sp. TaxID=1872621 RepID=UPI0025BF1616